MGGRLALINSFMDSIPTYFMPLFPVTGKVFKKLDKSEGTPFGRVTVKDTSFTLIMILSH